MQATLKRLMVGTASALLAAGCGSTGSAGKGVAASPSASPPLSPSASPSPSAPAAVTGTVLGTATPPGTSVYDCDRQPVAQPKTYVLLCGDAGSDLEQLVWTHWGDATATATGVQVQNNCVPSCAAGSPISTRATATLSGLTGGHYTKLRVLTAKGTSDYTIDAAGPAAMGAR